MLSTPNSSPTRSIAAVVPVNNDQCQAPLYDVQIIPHVVGHRVNEVAVDRRQVLGQPLQNGEPQVLTPGAVCSDAGQG